MNKIKLTEKKLRQIVNESVKNVLNEAMSTDYRGALKQIFAKSFGNLDDNEKQFLYDLLSNETWETVYVALETLKPYNPYNKVNEGKTVNNKPLYTGEKDKFVKPGELSFNNAFYVDKLYDRFFQYKGYEGLKGAADAVRKGELDGNTFIQWVVELWKGLDKHNERTKKY